MITFVNDVVSIAVAPNVCVASLTSDESIVATPSNESVPATCAVDDVTPRWLAEVSEEICQRPGAICKLEGLRTPGKGGGSELDAASIVAPGGERRN